MSNRITNKDLECQINRINKLTDSPMETYTKTEDGYRANPGNYHLDGAYGGVKLVRLCNDGGGISDVSRDGFGTKRQLYSFMNAFIAGIEVERSL